MFVLKGILRAESQEKALLYLLLRGAGYGKAIAEFYGIPTNPVQKQLARLEEDGVVVSQLIGKVRNYELNPRYPFMEPLKALLKAAVAAYPPELRNRLLVQRTRPRQAGKPLVAVREAEGKGGKKGKGE
ncbi:winged helix-turn-helix domain-containing protein [Microbulbifer taiwanensis]|uniref:Winged helix-turn-helix domain-containing protein n=1 Tax=Microbulbifer taiwanensis TaxID=986746 RepID=A0ABW1YH12_9GAMM|nr:winged helix-turn-helix domain-containing protein [Microbulbifer taiwanensis]